MFEFTQASLKSNPEHQGLAMAADLSSSATRVI
jgi:hypothetical protein